MTQRRFPDTAYNTITIIGVALASVSLVTIAFLIGVELLQERPPPYIGLISYLILPVPLILGLLMIPIGMWRERRRLRQGSRRALRSLCSTCTCQNIGPLSSCLSV